ncbi:MAG TPA: peptidoglycan-binding protein [Blastocatellia bacterium]
MRLSKLVAKVWVFLLCMVWIGVPARVWARPKSTHRDRSRETRGSRGREATSRGRYSARDAERSRGARYADRGRSSRREARSYDRDRGRGRYASRDDRYDRYGRGRSGRLARYSRGRSRYDRRYESRYESRGAVSRSQEQPDHYIRFSDAEDRSAASTRTLNGIPADRVTEIQQALIKSGYLTGDPSGQYDSATSAAMKQFQMGNGFRASGLPSAESLKRLGVSKNSNDGYAVPIANGTIPAKKPAGAAAGGMKTEAAPTKPADHPIEAPKTESKRN